MQAAIHLRAPVCRASSDLCVFVLALDISPWHRSQQCPHITLTPTWGLPCGAELGTAATPAPPAPRASHQARPFGPQPACTTAVEGLAPAVAVLVQVQVVHVAGPVVGRALAPHGPPAAASGWCPRCPVACPLLWPRHARACHPARPRMDPRTGGLPDVPMGRG